MGQSKILAINELAEAQVQAFQTVNDGIDALEKATNRILHIDAIGLSQYIVTEHDFTRYQVFVIENATKDVDFKVPDTVNTINTNRVISVINKGIFNITVKTNALGGTDTVVITAASGKTVYIDTKEVNEISGAGGGGTGSTSSFATYAVYVQGKPNPSDEVLRYTFASIVELSASFAGSKGSVGVNPTATASFLVRKNGSAIGSISIDIAGAFTFTALTTTVFNPGDVLTVISPTVQDATLADIGITLRGLKQ